MRVILFPFSGYGNLCFYFKINYSALSWSYLISDSQIYMPGFDLSPEIWMHPSKGLLDSIKRGNPKHISD